MQAGLLTEQIVLYKPEISTNDFGEETTNWVEAYTTRARLLHTGGGREIQNSEVFYATTKQFQVRYYIPVENYYRIFWQNKYYRIIDIEPNKQQQLLTIKADLVND